MPRMVHKNHNKDNGNEGASKEEGGEGMKKGPWTQAEDAMLREYVMKYGEGNWNSVQKNSGLSRCGKSCRLRWANHLRPNLKKGAFSKEEEQIIILLHAKLGSKWAQMAAQLPGRTDNEIKNFWNTRMKRRQRAGLPLYPPEVFLQEAKNTYYLEQQKHKQNFRSQPHSPSSLSFSTFLSSSYPQELNTLSHSSTTNPQQNVPNSSSLINSHPQFKSPNDKFGMVLPPSTVSSHGYSFNQCNSMARSQQQDSLSSSQSAHDGSTTPTSSHNSGVYGLMGASSGVANGYYEDAQVVEAQSLSHNDKLMSEDSTAAGKNLSCNKRKSMTQEDGTMLVETTMENSGNFTNKKQRNDVSSSQFLTGKKLIYEDSMEELNSMDDDLFSLLNNFPSEVPVPGWYRNGERQSLGLETQQDASSSSPTGQEFAWTLGNFWSNVPNIC